MGQVIFDPATFPTEMAYTEMGSDRGAAANANPAVMAVMGGSGAPGRAAPGSGAAAPGKQLTSELDKLKRAMTSDDIKELKRADSAWDVVSKAQGVDDKGMWVSTLTLQTDAVDATSLRVSSRLIRPQMLVFSEAADGDADNKLPIGAEVPAGEGHVGVVDFGSTQVGVVGKRMRVSLVNPLSDAPMCVALMPLVSAGGKKLGAGAGMAGAGAAGVGLDGGVLAAANTFVAGVYAKVGWCRLTPGSRSNPGRPGDDCARYRCLKLDACDKPILNSAFNVNLRRYTKDSATGFTLEGGWLTPLAPPGYGLSDSAHHVIPRSSNPRFFSQMASYDAASNICRTIPSGILAGIARKAAAAAAVTRDMTEVQGLSPGRHCAWGSGRACRLAPSHSLPL